MAQAATTTDASITIKVVTGTCVAGNGNVGACDRAPTKPSPFKGLPWAPPRADRVGMAWFFSSFRARIAAQAAPARARARWKPRYGTCVVGARTIVSSRRSSIVA